MAGSRVVGSRGQAAIALVAMAAVASSACTRAALVERADARRLTSELELQFTKVVDASNRAVLAVSDEDSVKAAHEAHAAATGLAGKRRALLDLLTSLHDDDALPQLSELERRLVAFEALDAEVLSLAVENTNIKAQRLSFGLGREAANECRSALEAAAAASGRERARLSAAHAIIAIQDIQILQGPHIAEAAQPAMQELERQMKASERVARARIADLRPITGRMGARDLDRAAAALQTFIAVNAEIVALSRRNTNVRSLGLALGEFRRVTAGCDEQLARLRDSVGRAENTGTR